MDTVVSLNGFKRTLNRDYLENYTQRSRYQELLEEAKEEGEFAVNKLNEDIVRKFTMDSPRSSSYGELQLLLDAADYIRSTDYTYIAYVRTPDGDYPIWRVKKEGAKLGALDIKLDDWQTFQVESAIWRYYRRGAIRKG